MEPSSDCVTCGKSGTCPRCRQIKEANRKGGFGMSIQRCQNRQEGSPPKVLPDRRNGDSGGYGNANQGSNGQN